MTPLRMWWILGVLIGLVLFEPPGWGFTGVRWVLALCIAAAGFWLLEHRRRP